MLTTTHRHPYLSISILLIIASILLSACGGAAQKQDEKLKIVMARVTGDPFYKTVECAALAEAAKLGVDLEIQGMSNFEIAEQTRVLDAIVQTKPDVIITAPVDADGMIPAFQRIKDAGIPAVIFDTTLNDKSLIVTEVVTDNFEQGKLAADALAKTIGETGKVFVLNTYPGLPTTDAEQQGFEEQIKNYPNIEYLGTEFNNNDQNRAVEIVNAMLTAHPDLAGFFATNTFGSQAAAAALRAAGKEGQVKIIAYDTTEEIIQGLKDGIFSAVLAYEAAKEGELAVQAAVKAAKGESVDKIYKVGNKILTADNVDNAENLYLRYVNECK
jgi:ribose transport system substrate-binding protein